MKKKQSYMNKSSIINEGILDKILDLIRRGKTKDIEKVFAKDSSLQKALKDYEKADKELMNLLKKKEKKGELKRRSRSGIEIDWGK